MSILNTASKAKLLKLMGTVKEALQKIDDILEEVPVQERQAFEKAVESWFESK